MKAISRHFPLSPLALTSLTKSSEFFNWERLYKLTNLDKKGPIIEWKKLAFVKESEGFGCCQIRIKNLLNEKYCVSLHTKRMVEHASYEVEKKKIRRSSGFPFYKDSSGNILIQAHAENIHYLKLIDLTTGDTFLYSKHPNSFLQKKKGVTLSMNPLDDENLEFQCMLSGLAPYENVLIKIGSNAKMSLSSSEKGEVVFFIDEKDREKEEEGSVLIKRYLGRRSEIEFTYQWESLLNWGVPLNHEVVSKAHTNNRLKRKHYEQTSICSRAFFRRRSFWVNKNGKIRG